MPRVPGVAGGEGGDGCPAAIVDADGDGVLDADDDCPNTPTGTTVGTDGCEVDPTDGTTDNGTDGGNTTTDGNTTTPGDNTGDGNTDGTTDGTEDNTDVTDVQSDSTIFGMSPMIVYALVGLIVVGLVSALLLRGRNMVANRVYLQNSRRPTTPQRCRQQTTQPSRLNNSLTSSN